ncbi:MAG: HAMP domain-containing histidine kinase [Gammaproteobacteria bacterium]|nr:HAMP domain-containing histidine kinase [Gammaproteobacteria bacterium]MBU1624872.1 HAMP domain-containing histidine kinase [Gammaproteobacteria bacterium]MBU1982716.1 HAMP domain-containing histidine kinase [Gammaproteobacteria bacterium]
MTTLNPAQWARSSRWLSLAMLVFLHAAFWLGVEHMWARPLLLAHLGLFLIWQPVWRSEARLSWGNSLFILGVSLAALTWLNWWILAFWVGGLFALVGARAFSFYARWQRIYHLLVMAYLLAVLLLHITPHLFDLPAFDEVTNNLMTVALPLMLVVMALIPVEKEKPDAVQAIDFFYVLLLFTLLTVLVLGTLAFMTLNQAGYLDALLRTLFLIAVALFVLGALWHADFGPFGLQTSFSRYVLSIGTPLEVWLKQLAVEAQLDSSPREFIESATAHMIEMPWMSGMTWVSAEGHGTLGSASPHRVDLVDEDLQVTLFTRQAVAPTVLLHMRLLVQVLGYFYQAKRREQRLREITRQQAIYETGARMTHDLKNMLQSLFALASIAQSEPAKAQPILQQQLPVLSQRIESLLDKLKSPGLETDAREIELMAWWEELCQRYQHRGFEWQLAAKSRSAINIPAAMFDCAADNLIENALNKRLREPGLKIVVSLDAESGALTVSDNGSAIPAGYAEKLLRTVVPSEDGLGVGLYQAARWAGQHDFMMRLVENEPGKVSFSLARH